MTSRTELLAGEYLRREGSDPKKFRYFWPDGTPYKDRAGIERIARLAVPPAYGDVYVSPDPDAELQAFGRDAAGRLQYRYHPDFVQAGALKKWQRLTRFAGALGTLKTVTAGDLRAQGLPPRKVTALMTRLLHVARFRVGSDIYAQQHKTYGLSTLRQRHVQVGGNIVTFHFKGKHGITQHKATTDRTLATNITRLLELGVPDYLLEATLIGVMAQRLVRRLPVGESVVNAILTLVRSARSGPDAGDLGKLIAWGPSPRASQSLMLVARARALLDGRLVPSIDDVIAMAEPVLKHRMALTFAARAEGETIGGVIRKLTSRIG